VEKMKSKIIFLLSLLIFTSLVVSIYALAQPRTLEVKIYKGWNLVSLAIMGVDPQNFETTCSPQDLIVLYGYDPIEKRYVKIKDITEVDPKVGIFGSTYGFVKLSEETGKYIAISPVSSGWLYSIKDCSMTLRAGVPADFVLVAAVNIYTSVNAGFPAGWNFFTVFHDMVGKSLDDIKGDCTIKKAYIWNPEDKTWLKLKEQKFSEPLLGYGFVFKTANDCLLGKVAIPEVPRLPEGPPIPEEVS